jgi:hypothetical protein
MSGQVMVYRRRFKRIEYPASREEWEAGGYRPEAWDEDFAGTFWVKVLANPNGAEERMELKLRVEFLSNSTDDTREAYRRELAWRVPEWNYATENDDGEIVPVAAPGASPDNWNAFELLPSMVASWLTSEIQNAHRPKATTPTSGQPGTPDSPLAEGPTQEP